MTIQQEQFTSSQLNILINLNLHDTICNRKLSKIYIKSKTLVPLFQSGSKTTNKRQTNIDIRI